MRAVFERRMSGELPGSFDGRIDDYKRKLADERPTMATRKASEAALEVINGVAAGDARRLGRPDRLEQHQDEPDDLDHAGRLLRPLHPLRRPRARHGRRDERHRAAWRAHPLFRRLPDLHRLLPAGDPPGGADGPARGPRPDPRFDRARRGRPDAPARRAARGAAGHAGAPRLPPGGRDGDRRMLAACARIAAPALRHRAVAAGPAAGAHRLCRGKPVRLRRLRPVAGRATPK